MQPQPAGRELLTDTSRLSTLATVVHFWYCTFMRSERGALTRKRAARRVLIGRRRGDEVRGIALHRADAIDGRAEISVQRGCGRAHIAQRRLKGGFKGRLVEWEERRDNTAEREI